MSKLDAVGFGALNVDKLFKVNRIAVAEEESFVVDHSEACGGFSGKHHGGLGETWLQGGFHR